MRLMVFFDLPVVNKCDRRAYTIFRRFLIKDGYDMIQFFIYARVCNGLDGVEKHVVRLQANKPDKGSVRYMQVTEKQFANIQVLIGKKNASKKENPQINSPFFEAT